MPSLRRRHGDGCYTPQYPSPLPLLTPPCEWVSDGDVCYLQVRDPVAAFVSSPVAQALIEQCVHHLDTEQRELPLHDPAALATLVLHLARGAASPDDLMARLMRHCPTPRMRSVLARASRRLEHVFPAMPVHLPHLPDAVHMDTFNPLAHHPQLQLAARLATNYIWRQFGSRD